MVGENDASGLTSILSSLGPALQSGSDLRAYNGNGGYYDAIMQTDGNFVIYDGPPIWASGTNGKGVGPYRLVMQTDGNLVIYDSGGRATWATGTNGKGVAPYLLKMQTDRNLVIYDSNSSPIWASGTQGK